MTLIPYTKPHATALQRVTHLRARGLHIPQPNVAAKKIDSIGYERLRIYFLSRRDHTLAHRPFLHGTSYRDILRIYEFDEKLRAICFDAIGKYELLFRNAMSEELSQRFGGHPYENVAAFKNAKAHAQAYQMLLSTYDKSKDQRAKHYRAKYNPPLLPPIWTMKEFLTFGAAGRLFKCLDGTTRGGVARGFGVPSTAVFQSWQDAFVDLRNICAHHDRLFNRSFQKQPQTLNSASIPSANPTKLKAIIECLDHCLKSKGKKPATNPKVAKLLSRYSEVTPTELGY
ncbi:Abi family protein [Erythrobacter sp. SCSIO 43205]|nr:Abi family protein [Erythrobacter sp. SCSIO 43205]